MLKVNNKQGMTLNEIMIALLVMAVAFIPTIGVLSTAMRATEKDDHIIKGMALCQEKLNTALQFPLGEISNGTYKNTVIKSKNTTADEQVILNLKTENYGIDYNFELVVASETVQFRVPMFDFTKMAQYKRQYPTNWKSYSSYWYKGVSTSNINHLIKRFTVTVKWKEKEGGEDNEKFYTLSALKANVR